MTVCIIQKALRSIRACNSPEVRIYKPFTLKHADSSASETPVFFYKAIHHKPGAFKRSSTLSGSSDSISSYASYELRTSFISCGALKICLPLSNAVTRYNDSELCSIDKEECIVFILFSRFNLGLILYLCSTLTCLTSSLTSASRLIMVSFISNGGLYYISVPSIELLN